MTALNYRELTADDPKQEEADSIQVIPAGENTVIIKTVNSDLNEILQQPPGVSLVLVSETTDTELEDAKQKGTPFDDITVQMAIDRLAKEIPEGNEIVVYDRIGPLGEAIASWPINEK